MLESPRLFSIKSDIGLETMNRVLDTQQLKEEFELKKDVEILKVELTFF